MCGFPTPQVTCSWKPSNQCSPNMSNRFSATTFVSLFGSSGDPEVWAKICSVCSPTTDRFLLRLDMPCYLLFGAGCTTIAPLVVGFVQAVPAAASRKCVHFFDHLIPSAADPWALPGNLSGHATWCAGPEFLDWLVRENFVNLAPLSRVVPLIDLMGLL